MTLPSGERDASVSPHPSDEDDEADDSTDAAVEDDGVDAAVEAGGVDAAVEAGALPVGEDATTPTSEGCSFDPAATPVVHSNTVTTDESWGAGPHLITFQTSVRAGATLTIAPCALVRVRVGQGIDVWSGGRLIAEGTKAQPIRFEPELSAGKWTTFQVYEGGSVQLAYASLSGAGASNDDSAASLSLRGTFEQPVMRVQHVSIEDAPKFGVRLDSGALFSSDSVDLTVKSAGEFPVISHPGSAGSLPSGTYTGNTRDEILIVDGSIQRDMTLRDLGVPYHVGRIGSRNTSLRVAKAGTAAAPEGVPLLTIEAGVSLRFEPAAVMEIEHFTGTNPASGALRVLGSAERPVRFTSAASPPAAGDWVGIWFGGVPDPRNLIDHARIEYAGGLTGALNQSCDNPAAPAEQRNRSQAAVLIMGPPASSFVTNTSIAHSASNGIQRGYFGAPLDFLASNSFEDVAWCQQSYPRPAMGACPMEVPCPR